MQTSARLRSIAAIAIGLLVLGGGAALAATGGAPTTTVVTCPSPSIDPSVDPEIHEYDAAPRDIYLLCSDGLCDMVSDDDIRTALLEMGANLELAAQQLVQMANDNGGRDNVSVILVRVLREYPGPRGVVGKLFAWLK